MGAMFYKFPSGLCVYYISSSLWGFGERKLLTWWKPTTTAPPGTVAPAAAEDAPATGRGKPARTEPEPPGRAAQARPGHSGRSCSTQPMRPTPTPPRARKPASRAAANRPANATANACARFLSGGTGGLSVSVFVFEFVGCDKTAFAAAGTPFCYRQRGCADVRCATVTPCGGSQCHLNAKARGTECGAVCSARSRNNDCERAQELPKDRCRRPVRPDIKERAARFNVPLSRD